MSIRSPAAEKYSIFDYDLKVDEDSTQLAVRPIHCPRVYIEAIEKINTPAASLCCVVWTLPLFRLTLDSGFTHENAISRKPFFSA